MLIENKRGNYFFLKGIAPYSAGVVAGTGFEVIHARLPRSIPLRQALTPSRHTSKEPDARDRRCAAWSLRSPKPFSFNGFNQFNAGYIDVLKRWDILFDGMTRWRARILHLR